MSNVKNIKNNFIFSVISQIITICIGLIIPKITLLEYGSEVNGLLSSVNQLIIYLSLFEAGIQQVAIKSLYKPVHDDSKDDINAILSAVNKSYKKVGFFYSVGLVLLAGIYPLFVASKNIDYLTVFCVVLFSGLGNAILFFAQGKYRILLQVEGKNYILTNIQTIIWTLNSLSKIILLLLHYNVAVVIFVNFLISLLQVIYIYCYINKRYKWINLKVTPNKQALNQKNFMLIHQISGLIFNNTDVLLITFFCGLETVSVYAIYKLVITHIDSILQTVYSSFSFYLGQLFNTDKTKYIKVIDMVEVYYSAGVFAVYTVTSCLILPFVSLYTNGVTDIEYIRKTFAVMIICVELLTFMRIPMLNTINYAGKFKDTVRQSVLESAINIVVSIIGVILWDIQGVLLGTIVALLYRTTEVIVYTNKKILNRSSKKTFSIYLIDILLLLFVVTVYNLINIDVNSWKIFIITGVCLTPCVVLLNFAIMSLVFRNESIQIKNVLMKKLSRR